MSGRRRGAGEIRASGTNRPGCETLSRPRYEGSATVEARERSGPLIAVRAEVRGVIVAACPLGMLSAAAQAERIAAMRERWSREFPGCVLVEVA